METEKIERESCRQPAQAVTCSTCKYWRPDEDAYNEILSVRRCAYVAFAPDATVWDDDCNRVMKPEYEQTKAFVADASGYSASFYTKEDFACNQYVSGEGTSHG